MCVHGRFSKIQSHIPSIHSTITECKHNDYGKPLQPNLKTQVVKKLFAICDCD